MKCCVTCLVCRPAPYLASRGMKWIQRYALPGLSDDELKEHLARSHELVVAGLSRMVRKELWTSRVEGGLPGLSGFTPDGVVDRQTGPRWCRMLLHRVESVEVMSRCHPDPHERAQGRKCVAKTALRLGASGIAPHGGLEAFRCRPGDLKHMVGRRLIGESAQLVLGEIVPDAARASNALTPNARAALRNMNIGMLICRTLRPRTLPMISAMARADSRSGPVGR